MNQPTNECFSGMESGRAAVSDDDRNDAVCAFEVLGLRFRYSSPFGRSAHQWTLDNLSFQVTAGEIFGVVGPNGSGKTSLLKVMAKMLRPAHGHVRLFGQDMQRLSQREVARLLALVPQESLQVFPFTVAQTVLMGRYPHRRESAWTAGFGWDTPDDIALAEQAMAEMDIAHLAGRLITELSGGERQRTVIARALVQAPRVLLLDEPTAFLDLQHQIAICSIVRRLSAERGLTVVLVSHDLNLAGQYCDRILMLKDGALFRLGTPSEVIRPEVLRAVYGCDVLVDRHPESGRPRITLPMHGERDT
ncbi:MAG: ABC transporter ATP-binding protein [Nitrospirota bacterium]